MWVSDTDVIVCTSNPDVVVCICNPDVVNIYNPVVVVCTCKESDRRIVWKLRAASLE